MLNCSLVNYVPHQKRESAFEGLSRSLVAGGHFLLFSFRMQEFFRILHNILSNKEISKLITFSMLLS